MKVTKGVYCLTSPSGKRYVGISTNSTGIEKRWTFYRSLNCKRQPKLYNALKKYGPENFKYEVILETDDRERANRVEKQLIALWNLQNNNYGYNLTEGGSGNVIGKNHTLSSREKMSIIAKKRFENKENREKISKKLKGIIVSKDTLDKRIKSLRKMKKYKNIITGEVILSCLTEMMSKYGTTNSIHRGNTSKGWRLINE